MIMKWKRKRNQKGFTLMELVVTTAIMGTLAAFAIPKYLETSQSAKGTKSIDNVNAIGGAILQVYQDVAANGIGTNAIATFSAAVGDTLKFGTDVIQYDSLGTTATIDVEDIFPGGAPKSPFNDEYYIVSAVTPGTATWTVSGGGIVTLEVTQQPSLTIRDPQFSNIKNTFTP